MSAADQIEDLYAAPPADAYVDPDGGAWVLSRYADVLAAFLEPELRPVGSRGEDHGNARNEHGSLVVRDQVRDALSPAQLADWQPEIEAFSARHWDALGSDQPAEVLADVAKPLCLSVAMLVTGANPADRDRLGTLGDRVFTMTGEPHDSPQRSGAAEAVKELEEYFQYSTVPMTQPTFIGVSQTLPRLLTNGWLALFRHPEELARLRADPLLMPRALEELLRYAGIIPRLFRRALADVEVGAVRIGAGERVTLMVASANRDADRFPEPHRLDVSRRPAGQLQLGIGASSCAGARLIRMVNAVAISSMMSRFQEITVTNAISWRTGAGFRWPASVEVALTR